MKTLNCSNCGANLEYKIGSPISICKYCKSVNVLENVSMHISALAHSEEIKPRILLPQIKFAANYWASSVNSQGGHLWISDTEIFFKPSSFNYGNLSNKYMKISDIVSMVKRNEMLGLSRTLTITDKNERSMKLVNWSRDEIIKEIKNRKR